VSSSLANRTLERASSALRANPIACLPEIVKLMRTLSGNSVQVSVSDLAEVIQKDAVVLAKVIGAANTLGYNPNAAPISSIHQAVHVIGYERIRSLAMSLMLIEQTTRNQSTDEQKALAMQSLTAGALAQSLAGRCPGLDGEQAFVCAALRNFGRIIMVTCMLEEYRDAQKLADNGPDDEACRTVFGLTPLELGYELLKAANLPDEILGALRELPPSALAVLGHKPDQQMQSLVDLSSRLAGLSLSADLAAEDYHASVRQLLAGYEKLLPGIGQDIADHVASASRQLDRYVHAFKLKSLPAESLNRLKHRRSSFVKAEAAAAAGSAPPVAAEGISAAVTILPAAAPGMRDPARTAAPDWSAQISHVSGLIDKPGVSPAHVLNAVVQAVRHIMAAPECLLLTGTADPAVFSLHHGHGALFKSLGGRAVVDVRDRTVLSICLQRQESIMIHHAHEPKIQAYLPAWLKGAPGLGAYALLPLSEGKTACGVMLAGWPDSRQIDLSPAQVRSIRELLRFASGSCRRLAH